MKRILILNMNYKTGGIRKSFENIVRFYSKDNRVDIRFFSQPGDVAGVLMNQNIRVLKPLFFLDTYYSSREEIAQKSFFPLRFAAKVLLRILRKLIGSEKLVRAMIDASPAVQEYDIAIAYSHDNHVGGFSGGCNYYVANHVKAKKKYAWIHGEIGNIGLDRETALSAYEGFDKVINVSKACDESFRALTEGKICSDYIYNLFDLDEILSMAMKPSPEIRKDVFTFVTVARMHPVKRIDKINTVSKRLSDEGYAFQWYVVGGGEKLEDYQREAKELGIDGVVHYTGDQKNPYRFMRNADLFVLLSDSESFSIVINEALILGLPVVTTDFPAAHESVQHGVNGFIVDKTEQSMYEQLRYCLEHQEEMAEMRRSVQANARGEALVNMSEKKLIGLLDD